jgi:hypothetical protein
MAGASDPLDVVLAEERPLPYRPLLRVRAAGVGIAWFAAVWCGWKSAQQADLLAAVLRGGAAWLGITCLWIGGVILCERLITRSRPAEPPQDEERPDA